MKSYIKKIIQIAIHRVALYLTRSAGGRYAYQQFLDASMNMRSPVQHGGVSMEFVTPNYLCRYRADSFSHKEPDTLTWLENIPEGAVLWDVGANIGLYSIYAAKKSKAVVFAFEPSVFNLEILARNIYHNGLQKCITIVPIALSYTVNSSSFKLSSTSWGGALSSFGEDFDQHGGVLNSIFEYQIMGMTMDAAITLLNIPAPRYIKIDVDGIEHFILRGGVKTLESVESVLLEIDYVFTEQAEETELHLQNAGLTLVRKCGGDSGTQYNQWWVRFNN